MGIGLVATAVSNLKRASLRLQAPVAGTTSVLLCAAWYYLGPGLLGLTLLICVVAATLFSHCWSGELSCLPLGYPNWRIVIAVVALPKMRLPSSLFRLHIVSGDIYELLYDVD